MALNYLSLRNYVEPNVSIGNLSVSTLSGSTVTGTSSGVFPSTLTVSTLTGSTLFGSALSGSTLSVSSLTGSALSLQTLSTTSATLTTGNLFLSTGKLGVGTNAPSAYLTVNGSITINSLNGAYEPGCIYSDSNWGMLFRGTVSTPTNSHFGWYSADGTQLMRIGIGNDFVVSTSLTSYLGNGLYTAYNDLGFTAATVAAGSFPYGGTITGPTGGVYTFTAANGSSYILLPVTLIIGVTYKVSITVRSSSSTTLLLGNNIATTYYQSPTLTSTLTAYTFSFVASGSTQLTVGPVPAGSGVILEWSAFSLSRMDTTVTGSLGIGGSTPKTRLSIYHNGTVSTIGSSHTQFAGLHLAPSGTDYSYTGITFGGNTTYMDTTQAGIICQSSPFMGTKMIFQTTNSYVDGGINRMTIDALGNVGIGTTTPTTSLEINTSTTTAGILSTRYYLRSPGDNQDSTGDDNAYGPWYGLGWSGITGIAGDPIPCLTGYGGVALRSGSGYLFLAGSGNVGIGTTNPNYKLKIEQGVGNNLNGIFISNTNYGSMQGLDISMVNAGSGNFYSYASIQAYTSGVSASTPISLQPTSGNVGIGITNPDATLYIYGRYYGNQYSDTYVLNVNAIDSFNGDGSNTVYSGNSINLKAGDLTWGGGTRSYGSQIYIGGGYSVNGAVNSAEIKMYTGGGERMRITAGGNVGIGTNTADQKLHIYGNIRIDARASYYTTQTANTTYAAGTWYTILPVGNLNTAATYLVSFVWNASPGIEPWGLGGSFLFNSGAGTNDVYGGQPGMTGAAIPTSYHAINNNGSDWQIYVRAYANGFMTSPGIQFKINAALPAGSWTIMAHIISY